MRPPSQTPPWPLALAALPLLCLMVAHTSTFRALALLARFSSGDHPSSVSRLLALPSYDVDETEAPLALPAGETRWRLYRPRGLDAAPAIVLAHGVHHAGIDEPRLTRFARSIAAAGVTVATPELRELADYRVDAASVETIGEAALRLARDARRAKVGVMGMSFAGGLSLLTALDPRYRDTLGFVVSVGGYDDLARVERFFVDNETLAPGGVRAKLTAHEYGVLVLAYAHVEDFFEPGDVDIAREALRLWLHDRHDLARARAADLGPRGAETLGLLLESDWRPAVLPALARAAERHAAEAARLSPAGHLAGLRADVYLLHGASDNVIPATETLWLAHDVPPERLRRMLVSNAIQHVEVEGAPAFSEQWQLVRFMGAVLDAAGGESAP